MIAARLAAALRWLSQAHCARIARQLLAGTIPTELVGEAIALRADALEIDPIAEN